MKAYVDRLDINMSQMSTFVQLLLEQHSQTKIFGVLKEQVSQLEYQDTSLCLGRTGLDHSYQKRKLCLKTL